MIKLCGFFALLIGFVLADPGGLYSNTSIVELDAESFEAWKASTNRSHASVVQFYSSKSALSKSYVPVYLEAANFANNWTGFVKFFAVDCRYNNVTLNLCKKYGYKHAPLIKYFSVNSTAITLGKTITTFLNATDVVQEVVAQLVKDFADGKCHKCLLLLTLYDKFATLHDLWNKMHKKCFKNQFVLIPINDKLDLIGFERLVQLNRTFEDMPLRPFVIYIPKSHPLIKNAQYEVKSWEILMLTAVDDSFTLNWKQYSNYKLIGQIPISPAVNIKTEGTNECRLSYPSYEKISFENIIDKLEDPRAQHVLESARIGAFLVQHYYY